jgi:hypothetical protein
LVPVASKSAKRFLAKSESPALSSTAWQRRQDGQHSSADNRFEKAATTRKMGRTSRTELALVSPSSGSTSSTRLFGRMTCKIVAPPRARRYEARVPKTDIAKGVECHAKCQIKRQEARQTLKETEVSSSDPSSSWTLEAPASFGTVSSSSKSNYQGRVCA